MAVVQGQGEGQQKIQNESVAGDKPNQIVTNAPTLHRAFYNSPRNLWDPGGVCSLKGIRMRRVLI